MLSPPRRMCSPTASGRGRARPASSRDGDQGEVGGAAADVADEDHGRPTLTCLRQPSPLLLEPRVEGGLRLLEQGHVLEPGRGRRLRGQLARRGVERRRDGQQDFLRFQAQARIVLRDRIVPRIAQVLEHARLRREGREPRHVRRRFPGQDRRRAIHLPMPEPGLGRGHHPPRHLPSPLARELADGEAASGGPRQIETPLGEIVLTGEVEIRREERARSGVPRRHHLRHLEELDRGACTRCYRLGLGVEVSEDRVGGPEIDPDDHARLQWRRCR